jgi:uncharacterized protein (TIRG00374 family)
VEIFGKWRFWLGSFVSLLCLWLALRKVPLGELMRLLTEAELFWLGLALIIQLFAVVARAWRWTALLEVTNKLGDSIWAQGVGYLFTNIFPLRLGEPARVIVMSERCALPVARVAATAIVERMLDVATIIFALVLVLPLMKVPPLVAKAGLFFGTVILIAFLILLLAVRFSDATENVLLSLCRRLRFISADLISARWRELVEGFAAMTRGLTAARAALGSLITWALSIATYFCVIRAFQPDGSWLEAIFMIVALSLAVAVPSSPGFVGVFQFAGQQALVLPFGSKYTSAVALTIAIAGHLTYYLLTTSIGVIGLWRLGTSLTRIGRVIKADWRDTKEK